jgi:hypothetical protein
MAGSKKNKSIASSQKSASSLASSAKSASTAASTGSMESMNTVRKGGGVHVPYGNAISLDVQTRHTKDKITKGLKEVLSCMNHGQSTCADRSTIDDHCARLTKQADKILEALGKDEVYVEEVRHHHGRILDLCDDTRAYGQEQMLSDLKRANHIRQQVLTIIHGKEPDYEIDQDEQDDLKTVRNLLRRTFGGNKAAKGTAVLGESVVKPEEAVGMIAGELNPSDFKARTLGADNLFGANIDGGASDDETMRNGQASNANKFEAGWASNLVGGM